MHDKNLTCQKLGRFCSNDRARDGDIRFGFRVLLTAGLIADRAGKKTIDTADIATAIEEESRVQELKKLDAI